MGTGTARCSAPNRLRQPVHRPALLHERDGARAQDLLALLGEGAPDAGEIEPRIEARGMDADVKWGGQPHYPLLLSAE